MFARTSASEFVLVGPQAAGTGTTQLLSTNVNSSPSDVAIPVVIALVNNNPVYMISDVDFTPSSTQPSALDDYDITGHFPVVKKGITLIRTPSTGITGQDDDTNTAIYWGTSSNALKLNGLDSSNFISSAGAGSALEIPDDEGIKIGDSLDLQLHVTNGNEATISNLIGNEIKFQSYTASTGLIEIARIQNDTDTGFVPFINNAYVLEHFKKMEYSTQITFVMQLQMLESLTDYPGALDSTGETVAIRDVNGNLVANVFTGTASRARYADLAEKYSTAEELAPGTAVAVGGDDDYEVRPAKSSDVCIGVVSTDPAYMMNSDAQGQYIGLKGRLPIRVKGPVAKGQAIYAWEDGVCSTVQTTALVGIALESNEIGDEKLVECVLKT